MEQQSPHPESLKVYHQHSIKSHPTTQHAQTTKQSPPYPENLEVKPSPASSHHFPSTASNLLCVVDSIIRSRRPLTRTLLPFPSPPTPTSTTPPNAPRRPQEIYLILNPKDDKCERRVIQIPPPQTPPVRVGRVINPSKVPAKFDNLLFDTKVLSRNHAEVFCDGQGRVFIRDLGSSNGA